jgi:polysaccharide export outer membrane protein
MIPTVAIAEGGADGYLINSGDLLDILVWKEPELTGEVIVRPDGYITHPLVGSLEASGSTVENLQKAVASRLERYIPDPVVTVSLKSLSGNRIYVIGKVNKPGVFLMNQNMDVMQALAVAGGLTAYASGGSIKVLRREAGVQSVFRFDYSDIEDGDDLEQNLSLQSGDTIIVP